VKVILKQDVRGVGKSGAVAEVADGYGRNFLLPRGLAEEASAGNMAQLAGRKAASAKRSDKQLAQSKELAALLESGPIVVKAKAGEHGRLFGAVTNAQIAEAIKTAKGVDLDRHKIELEEPIKAVGDYACSVRLPLGVSASVAVRVSAA
jgi:large subunit ribosomal protein L9